MGVSDDQKDPDRYTLYMSQSGLGLGDRQMYLDEKFAPQRERYQAYIAQMLGLAGWPKPAGQEGCRPSIARSMSSTTASSDPSAALPPLRLTTMPTVVSRWVRCTAASVARSCRSM